MPPLEYFSPVVSITVVLAGAFPSEPPARVDSSPAPRPCQEWQQQPRCLQGSSPCFPAVWSRMKQRCHSDKPTAQKKHSQSLRANLEEARTAGLELNKQADKQGMTILGSPELSAALGGFSRSIRVTRGESEGNAEQSVWHFMEEKPFVEKIFMAKCSPVQKIGIMCLSH